MKWLVPIMCFGLALYAVWFAISAYGASREREGLGKAIRFQTNTDLQHALAQIERSNAITEKLMADARTIMDQNDDTVTGPAVGVWLRDTAPVPTRKPGAKTTSTAAH